MNRKLTVDAHILLLEALLPVATNHRIESTLPAAKDTGSQYFML